MPLGAGPVVEIQSLALGITQLANQPRRFKHTFNLDSHPGHLVCKPKQALGIGHGHISRGVFKLAAETKTAAYQQRMTAGLRQLTTALAMG